MATRQPRIVEPDPLDPDALSVMDDELGEEELEQAAVGDLFTIQGDEFAQIEWSISRFRTREEIALDPQGKREGWVADRVGELHGRDLQDSLGGGTFRLRGYRRVEGNRVRIAHHRIVAIEGPRKDLSQPPPKPPAEVGIGTTIHAPVSRAERMMLKMIRLMDARMAQLEQRAQAPAAVAPTPIGELVTALDKMDVMRNRGQPEDSGGLGGIEVLEILKKGVEIGQAREPIEVGEAKPGKSVLDLLGEAMPLFNKLLDARISAAQRAGPRRPPSSARVVEAPPSRPQAPEPDISDVRMITAVDALNRAIAEAVEPEDFAATLETILPADQLALLTAQGPDEVIAQIIGYAAERYPLLATDGGKVYIGAVLAELKRAPEDEPQAT